MVEKRLPPLNWLRSFEASARHLSFTGAATELNITQSAVSQQVRLLENFLGEGLFRRRARGLDLTDAGKTYLPSITEAFGILEQGTQTFLNPGIKSNLEIKANTAFSVLWLAPRIPQFLSEHPDMGLTLSTVLWPSDYGLSVTVVEIRYGHGEWDGQKGERLTNEHIYPVCSPAVAERLSSPEDLSKVPLIHIYGLTEDWSFWFKHAGVAFTPSGAGHAVNTFVLSLQLARNGLGVALGHDLVAGDLIESGELVVPFDIRVPARDGYYLLQPAATTEDSNTAIFRRWLLQTLNA